MARDINMTLKAPVFNPVAYNPVQYTPQTPAIEILQRSLAQIEARRDKAVQAKNAVNTALGEIERKINPNETEWFNNYKNNINKQIAESYDVGDYGNAYRTAIDLAGQTAKDTAISIREKANADQLKWEANLQAKLDKKEITPDTFQWAIDTNPYSLIENTVDGVTVGGKLADKNTIYDTINWNTIAAQAAAFFRPDVEQNSQGGTSGGPALFDTKEKALQKLKGLLGDKTGGSKTGWSLEQVKPEDILDTIGALLNNPDLKNQAIQDYEVNKYMYKKKLDSGELTNADKRALLEQGLLDKNGNFVSPKQYIADKSKSLIDALSYRKYSYEHISTSNFSISGKKITQDGDDGEYPIPTEMLFDDSWPVNTAYDPDKPFGIDKTPTASEYNEYGLKPNK